MSHLIQPTNRFYDAKTIGELLNVSTKQVWGLVRQGQLPKPIIRTEHLSRFNADEVDRFLGIANA